MKIETNSINIEEFKLQGDVENSNNQSRQNNLQSGIDKIEKLIGIAKTHEEKIAYQNQLCFLMMKLKMHRIGRGVLL